MSPLGIIFLVLLILLLIGALPAWPYSANWGIAPVSTVGVLIIVLLILLLSGKL